MTDRFLINDVARLLRVSPESIRFYEKKNIVSPVRDNENGYRYFTQADIRRLYDCRIYQSLGFSLTEIIEIFQSASAEKLEEMLGKKEKELELAIEENTRALRRIRRVSTAKEAIDRCTGRFYIQDSPHSLFAYHSEFSQLDRKNIGHRFWDCVSDYYNLFVCAAVISPEIARDPQLPQKMKCGFVVDYDTGLNLGLTAEEPVYELKPRRSVYTTFHAEPIVTAEHLAPALAWMEAHGHKLTGDIICNTPKISFDQGVDSRLYEVWLPIEE